MTTKNKSKVSSKEAAPAPAKKLYLLRAEDVKRLVFELDGEELTDFETRREIERGREKDLIICKIELMKGGRIVQIDDTPEGRGVLTSNIRRIVGDKATTRLLSGAVKSDKN